MEELYQDDQEFLEILARAERAELCAYRNLIIDELHARGEWAVQRKQRQVTQWQRALSIATDYSLPMLNFVVTAMLIIAAATMQNGREHPAFMVLTLVMAGFNFGSGVVSLWAVRRERKLRREAATQAFYAGLAQSLQTVLAERANERNVEDARERMHERRLAYTVHHDSKETLIAKKAKLDEMLGFAMDDSPRS